MTENEALNKLHAKIVSSNLAEKITEQEMMAFCKAKNALEEIQQYHDIGTVEECRAAVEKQKTKKMESAWCPCCGKYLTAEYMNKKYHCIYCGQKLDWGDEE